MKGHFSWRRQKIKEYMTKQGTILTMGVCGKERLRQARSHGPGAILKQPPWSWERLPGNVMGVLKPWSPHAVTYFLQQGRASKPFSNSSTYWKPSIQTCEGMGVTLVQTTTEATGCRGEQGRADEWEWSGMGDNQHQKSVFGKTHSET